MNRYSIGIILDPDEARVIIVDVRSGQVALDRSTALENACADALRDAAIHAEQIIGIGIVNALGIAATEKLGLPPHIPVAIAKSSGHASVPGAGIASPSTMLMILDPVSRFFMNSRTEANVGGVARGEADSILPGYFGYEWPALDGLAATDPSIVETSALELRRRIQRVRDAGVQVRRFVACGSIWRNSPETMQLLADVLDARIKPASSDDPAPIGAAILGALAAGIDATGHSSMSQLIHTLAPRRNALIYRPDVRARKAYAFLPLPPGEGRGEGAR